MNSRLFAFFNLFFALILMNSGYAETAAIEEGKQYQLIPESVQQDPLVSLNVTPQKIKVTEFFSFACPACNVLSVSLRDWVHKQGNDVIFQRVPVNFHQGWDVMARVYYAADDIGVLDKIDADMFSAIHDQNQNVLDKDVMAKFLTQHAIDPLAFDKAMTSFAVDRSLEHGEMMRHAYRVNQVPTVIVNNQYMTDLGAAGGVQQMLATLDFLIAKARQK